MKKSSYEVEVIINGKPAKEYSHDGKIFIEGREGTKFSLRFHNDSWWRKLFVPAIDGLSIIDGKPASYKSSGYIVNGHSTITIDGWRENTEEVAEFYFSSPERAYAHRINKDGNLGVIGVAVFDERIEAYSYHYYYGENDMSNYYQTQYYLNEQPSVTTLNLTCGGQLEAAATTPDTLSMPRECCSVSNSAVSQSIGTGWGDTKKSKITTVEFKAKDAPESIFEIFYNTREQLELMGVDFKKTPLYVAPQAFPGQYCKPPQD